MKYAVLVALPLAVLVVGCKSDPNQPKTLQEQRDLVKGHQPTPDELDRAMSRYKAPDNSKIQTPSGSAQPGGNR